MTLIKIMLNPKTSELLAYFSLFNYFKFRLYSKPLHLPTTQLFSFVSAPELPEASIKIKNKRK